MVGGVSRLERTDGFSERVLRALEWVDTTRQGVHAIGNLERRIRDHRVAGLVLLEGVMAHKHSEPLVAAARHVGLPLAYAAKGGKAALRRAFAELDAALARSG